MFVRSNRTGYNAGALQGELENSTIPMGEKKVVLFLFLRVVPV